MMSFKHFLLELSRKQIFELRQEMRRVFAAGKTELAERLKLAPSSITTTMPRIEKMEPLQLVAELVIVPSKTAKSNPLIDWWKTSNEVSKRAVMRIYGVPLEERGFSITQVTAEKVEWEYGKVHQELRVSVYLTEQPNRQVHP